MKMIGLCRYAHSSDILKFLILNLTTNDISTRH